MSIKVNNISFNFHNKRINDFIFENISFVIKDNDFVSIIGPSGCGKSTLLNCIAGIEKITNGDIQVNEKDVIDIQQNVGFVFQENNLYPWLTVEQNIAFPLKLKDLGKAEIVKKTEELLYEVGLWDARKKYPTELSGGMKQKTAIARVLAADCKYLLLDEPFAALDYQTRIRMQYFLKDVCIKFNKTAVLVTHHIDEALNLSNRIFLMQNKHKGQFKELEGPFENKYSVTKSALIKHLDLNTSLLEKYNLKEQDVNILVDDIYLFLKNLGIGIIQSNLDRIVETDIYKVDRVIKDEDKHHETCISDGLDIWIHNDINDVGGVCGRLYDLLHVGCGHLWQWSANENSGLKFWGDNAWHIGSKFYLGANEDTLKVVYEYEREAGELAMANLNLILKNNKYSPDFRYNISKLFTDYLQTDLEYITNFYRTGIVKNIHDNWKLNANKVEHIHIDFELNPVRRSNKCLALIK
jgi:NitT/TauT family transport system ATP-binding protein